MKVEKRGTLPRILVLLLYGISILTFSPKAAFSQTVDDGIQGGLYFRPLIPSALSGNRDQAIAESGVGINFSPARGYSVGGFIEFPTYKSFSLLLNIGQTTRRFDLDLTDSNGRVYNSKFNFNTYEIGLGGRVGVPLSKRTFGSVHTQILGDFPLSNVITEEEGIYKHISFRKRWIVSAFKVGTGATYNTEKIGAFYLGAGYHRSLGPLTVSKAAIYYPSGAREGTTSLPPHYLYLELRYLFKKVEKDIKPDMN